MKKRSRSEESVIQPWRLVSLVVASLSLFAVIGWRYFEIQVINQGFLQNYGRQHAVIPRGRIYDRSMRELAGNRKIWNLYVNIPGDRVEQDQIQKALSGYDPQIARYFDRKVAEGRRGFTWMENGVGARKAARFKAMGLSSSQAGMHSGYARTYPYGKIAAQQIGFVGRDNQGLEGLEFSFDGVLGSPGGDAAHHIRLTLDFELQSFVEHALDEGLKKTGASGAMALVLEAKTGAILVAAIAPGFDPNHYSQYAPGAWRNRIVTDAYEPGSTIKPFVIGRAWQEKKIALDEIIFCENGSWQLGDHVIHDAEPYGWLSPVQTIIKSSNICTAKIARRLGKQNMISALRDFGFGRRLQNDLPGETRGILRKAAKVSELGVATMSFGQGLSVTPLQLAVAYNALASGGKLFEPYIVDALLDQNLTVVSSRSPQQLGQSLNPLANAEVVEMLRQVVVKGTGEKAALEGIPVAGKTGTAQVPDLKKGGYKDDEYTALFAGLLPVPNPLFSVVVLVENPQSSIYGGQVAAPIFRDIARVLAARARTLPTVAAQNPVAKLRSRRQRHKKTLPGTVPDFAGLTIREALQIARVQGLNLSVEGQGIVRSQVPAAGVKAANNNIKVLARSSDNG